MSERIFKEKKMTGEDMRTVFRRLILFVLSIAVLISQLLISFVCGKELDLSKLLIVYTETRDYKSRDLYLNNMTNSMKTKLIENVLDNKDEMYVKLLNENKIVYIKTGEPNTICFFNKLTNRTDKVRVPLDLALLDNQVPIIVLRITNMCLCLIGSRVIIQCTDI